ncbi:putative dehydrogenase [Handroanthus impetiginosus]|uniref:Putative dehydrogenase n=1 Tax=Handroanthus impetiginosus TaxID=429701 RepID=A0A2G9HIR8_9LAMI|nr:putative dehydrogenase [Handroanthus impetiginosus]
MSAVCVSLFISGSPYMASRLPQAPIADLPLSAKAIIKHPQAVPLLPVLPLNSPSFRYSFKRKVLPPPWVSRSNAVSDQVVESFTSGSTQDSRTTPSPPSSSKLVLVVGGTGGVGQLVVASLLDRNIKSRLLLRNPEKATTLFGEQDEDKLQVRQGDTRNPGDLDPSIFEGVTHVICCTGTTAFPSRRWDGDNTPERVDWEGVRNLVSALPSSLKRIVLVSSVGVTKFNELPWSIMNLFGVLKYKKMGEDFVRSSGLPFTIIRAGRLTDGPYTSYDLNTLLQATAGERRAVLIGQGDKLVGEVSRLVVAEACIQALDIDFTEGQIYEVNSVKGEGPGSDRQKWEELFKAAQKQLPL